MNREQIKNIRKQIDQIDDNLFLLLGERLDLVRKIAEFKQTVQLPVYCPKREKEILLKIRSVENEELMVLLEAVYQEIFIHARGLQTRLRQTKTRQSPGGL